MYLWRKRAELPWVQAHEELLQAHAHGELVIVRRPARKHLELEIACRSRSDSSALSDEFGGLVEALPRNWLERFERRGSKPIKIAKRLIISSGGDLGVTIIAAQGPLAHYHSSFVGIWNWRARYNRNVTSFFGTTDSPLEPGWLLVDVGTGSGILALSAKCLGAGDVIGIDNDAAAILVANQTPD